MRKRRRQITLTFVSFLFIFLFIQLYHPFNETPSKKNHLSRNVRSSPNNQRNYSKFYTPNSFTSGYRDEIITVFCDVWYRQRIDSNRTSCIMISSYYAHLSTAINFQKLLAEAILLPSKITLSLSFEIFVSKAFENPITGITCDPRFEISNAIEITFIYDNLKEKFTIHTDNSGKNYMLPYNSGSVALCTLFTPKHPSVSHVWLNFWNRLGIGHFFLYVNEDISVGNTIDQQEFYLISNRSDVTIIPWNKWPYFFNILGKGGSPHGAQPMAMNHCAQRFGGIADDYGHNIFSFMGFFDFDELFSTEETSISIMLSKISRPISIFTNTFAVVMPPTNQSNIIPYRNDHFYDNNFVFAEWLPIGRTKFFIKLPFHPSKLLGVHLPLPFDAAFEILPAKTGSLIHFVNLASHESLGGPEGGDLVRSAINASRGVALGAKNSSLMEKVHENFMKHLAIQNI